MQKNLQFLGLQFFDADGFGAWNAKFHLDLALAFPNANALSFPTSLSFSLKHTQQKSKYLFPITMAEHGGARTDISDFVWGFGSRCKRGTADAEDAVMGDARKRSGSCPFDIGGRGTFLGLAVLNVLLDWKWKFDFRWLRISVLGGSTFNGLDVDGGYKWSNLTVVDLMVVWSC